MFLQVCCILLAVFRVSADGFAASTLRIATAGCPTTWANVTLGGTQLDSTPATASSGACAVLCASKPLCVGWNYFVTSQSCRTLSVFDGTLTASAAVTVSGVPTGCHPQVAPDDVAFAAYWLKGNTFKYEVTTVGTSSSITAVSLFCDPTGNLNCTTQACSKCLDLQASSWSSGEVTVSNGIRNQINNANGYLLVQTQAFPAGELRANLRSLSTPPTWVSSLDASQLPSVSSSARGRGYFWVSGSTFSGTVYTTFTRSAYKSAALYVGPRGQTGQITPFSFTPVDNLVGATLTISGVLDTTSIQLLNQYRVYINVITTSFSSGEIRGQLYPAGVPIILNVTDFDALLASTVRGADNTLITFAVGLPSSSVGNEIWVTFPQGFTFNVGAASSIIFPINIAAPTLVIDGNIVQLRWSSAVSLLDSSDSSIRFTVTNVGLPNNCEQNPFVLSSHSCRVEVLFNTSSISVRKCPINPTSDVIVNKVIPAGLPQGCSPYGCEACKFVYKSPDQTEIYSCQHNGLTFFRAGVGGQCTNNP